MQEARKRRTQLAHVEHLCYDVFMLLSYKFRLYPNTDQRQALDRILEIHRQVYNTALQERRHAWKRCRVSIRYTD
jgi:putative transposase